jgi:hypothetical protein
MIRAGPLLLGLNSVLMAAMIAGIDACRVLSRQPWHRI